MDKKVQIDSIQYEPLTDGWDLSKFLNLSASLKQGISATRPRNQTSLYST